MAEALNIVSVRRSLSGGAATGGEDSAESEFVAGARTESRKVSVGISFSRTPDRKS